jgi:hypothetical protein
LFLPVTAAGAALREYLLQKFFIAKLVHSGSETIEPCRHRLRACVNAFYISEYFIARFFAVLRFNIACQL